MIDKIKEILIQNNYSIIMERPIPYGHRLELNNGTIILIYPHKNKYCFQGKNIAEVSRLLRDKLNKDNFDIAEKTTMVDLLNRETDGLPADHDKEVRKQVCDEIGKEIEFEFAAKNHTTRVERFEPPFKLTRHQLYEYLSKDGFRMVICKSGKKYKILLDYIFLKHIFDTYQEAIDYARKDFEGEE